MRNQNWLYGFFFIGRGIEEPELYFVCFQEGLAPDKAHQIVIATSKNNGQKYGKVAYITNPNAVKSLSEENLEKLCRIAVGQFSGKPPLDNFLALVLPLDLTCEAWTGPIIHLPTTLDSEAGKCLGSPSDRRKAGMSGDSLASVERHSSSLM